MTFLAFFSCEKSVSVKNNGLLIHSADARSRSAVITVFTNVVSLYISICEFLIFEISPNTTFSSENSDRYWQECGSGQEDHWWYMSFLFSSASFFFSWFPRFCDQKWKREGSRSISTGFVKQNYLQLQSKRC